MALENSTLIFAPGLTSAAARIAGMLRRHLPNAVCRICTNAERFEAELKKPTRRRIAILLASRAAVLDQLLVWSQWFRDTPLILMVPDNQRETMAKAHRLRPRYLMLPDIDFDELEAVVVGLLGDHRPGTTSDRSIAAPTLIPLINGTRRYFRIQKRQTNRKHRWIVSSHSNHCEQKGKKHV